MWIINADQEWFAPYEWKEIIREKLNTLYF